MDLHDRTVVVTGASRGIGKATAVEMGRRGANVVVAARTVDTDPERPGTIGETVAAVEATGAKVVAVQADMAEEADLERLMAAAVDAFGGVDVLVNNAAAADSTSVDLSLVELSRESWLWQFAVNLHAPFTLIQSAVPMMEERGGGRIINVTTQSTEVLAQSGRPVPEPGIKAPLWQGITPLAYICSKAALDKFCAAVAPQLATKNISICNLHPGGVRTEMLEKRAALWSLDLDKLQGMDVPARAIAWLASNDDHLEQSGRLFIAGDLVEAHGL